MGKPIASALVTVGPKMPPWFCRWLVALDVPEHLVEIEATAILD